MRHFILSLAACSGFAIAITFSEPFNAANAMDNKVDSQISSVGSEAQSIPANQTKVVCSRNHPLSLNAGGVKVASAIASQSEDWFPNVIKLFCRDVRINTIVVRDYCAVVRQQ